MNMSPGPRVVAFGSSRVQPGDPAHDLALAVGGHIGRHGLTVVSGGYAGTMGAVSEGTARAGGRVVGITTRSFADREANSHCDEVEVHDDYPSRMAALLRAGALFVALPGSLGTVSEWVTAWCLASIGQLGGPLWVFREPHAPVGDALMGLPESAAKHAEHLRWLDDADDFSRALDCWVSEQS